MRIATVRELADRGRTPAPSGLVGEDWRFADFDDFIAQYTATCALLTEPEDFRRIAYEFCEDEARNGVRYAEVVFSPSNHAPRLGDDWFGPIEAVLDGLEAGRRDFGRDGPRRARPRARRGHRACRAVPGGRAEVRRTRRGGVERRGQRTGRRSPPSALSSVGRRTRASDRCHTRVSGPDHATSGRRSSTACPIASGMECGRSRTRSSSSISPRRAIPLEVSPVSNVATGVYGSLAEHPFRVLRDAGVTVTLNSDDPPMFGAWLADVYRSAAETWSYDDDSLAEIARTGVRASFADDELKSEILDGHRHLAHRARRELSDAATRLHRSSRPSPSRCRRRASGADRRDPVAFGSTIGSAWISLATSSPSTIFPKIV